MRQKIILHKCILHSFSLIFRPNLSKIFKCINSHRDMATDTKFWSESKSDLKDIFRSAVKAVSPNEIVRKRVKLRDNTLYIDGRSFTLQKNVYLVGFGKAVMGMAVEIEKMLGNTLKKGIVSIPSGSQDFMWTSEDKSVFPKLYDSVIDYREGGINNQPDGRSLNTTHDIIDLVEKLIATDTLIVLVSGGGSALLYMPRPVLYEEDKLELCKKLQNAGAAITELNTVRKKLSLVKGGGLARMAHPASVITLILSDIVGDPVDLIASGPTVYSARAPQDVVNILKKYNLFQSLEGDLKTVLTSKETFNDAPLLNPAKQFKHVTNIILGNNKMALEAASFEASRKKLTPIILKNDVAGNVQDVSSAYADVTSSICLALSNELKREEFYDRIKATVLGLSVKQIDEIFDCICSSSHGNLNGIVLIGGGEPTVVVKGQGRGGRNQELALRFSLDWLAKIKSYPRLADHDVIMLSAGTDGQDGPTDAAGAFGYPAIAPVVQNLYAKVKSMVAKENAQTSQGGHSNGITKESVSTGNSSEIINRTILTTMEVERMLPENTLKENDSYNFYSRFKKGADLLKTGYTGTNVMDLHFIYIKRKPCKCEIHISDESTCEENLLDVHDLHIDASTIEKYRAIQASSQFDKFLQTPFLTTISAHEDIKEQKPTLSIKIIDENFTDPCCNKKRKLD